MEDKDWFKDRGYPHFSNKTPLSAKGNIEKYIINSFNIANHSFYPLLLKEIVQRRYKLTRFGDVEKRSHKKTKSGIMVSNKKIRKILYSTHIDAHIYTYYTRELSKYYEEYLRTDVELSNSISAYRRIPIEEDGRWKFKNNVHFAKDIFEEIRTRENCVALCYDIENFFPTLDHKLLKKVWVKILNLKALPKDHYNIFKAITKFSYVKLNDLKTGKHFDEKGLAKLRNVGKHTFFENIRDLLKSNIIIYKNQFKNLNKELVGIPQGLPISAILANIYMLPFDEAIVSDLSKKIDVYYRRYSDDIVVLCKEEDITIVNDFVKHEIEKLKLHISIDKTEITIFKIESSRLVSYRIIDGELKSNMPLNYLGFEFYGYQTLLKSKNLAAFYRAMKSAVNRKYLRSERIKEKYLEDSAPVFKRKIYRLYTFKGYKSRKLLVNRGKFIGGKLRVKEIDRRYRGNYIKYVCRAADKMNAPEIKRQVRNHWKILQATMRKYEFSNVKKED